MVCVHGERGGGKGQQPSLGMGLDSGSGAARDGSSFKGRAELIKISMWVDQQLLWLPSWAKGMQSLGHHRKWHLFLQVSWHYEEVKTHIFLLISHQPELYIGKHVPMDSSSHTLPTHSNRASRK